MLLNNYIEILKSILKESFVNNDIIKRSEIYYIFEERTKSGLELYRFEQEISKLIKNNIIEGYEIKVGRNGGITKKQETELISITCSSGNYIGYINKYKLIKLINCLENNNQK